jgi:electron transfer flavoprotein alpha subunit
MVGERGEAKETRGVWVFVEQRNGRVAGVSLELLGKGRILSDTLGVELTAVLMGYNLGAVAEELISFGADKVIVADDPLAADYRTEVYTHFIVKEALKEKPEIFLVGATCVGRDLAARISARLNTGCTADCTDLNIDQEKRLLVASKPFYGRSVMADIVCPIARPQVATVRPGVMERRAPDRNRKGEVISSKIGLTEDKVKVKVLETVRHEAAGARLEEAERVVVGGMGVGGATGFGMLGELAELLGAEVGATSLPVNAGWVSHDRQIGQTGKTIRPRLYIGCGVSGAIQHSVGMINSELIVAIDINPGAEIFGLADYGIVGDLHKVVQAVINELKRIKGLT